MNVNRGVRASFFKVALIAVVMSLFAVSCGGGDDEVQGESRIKNSTGTSSDLIPASDGGSAFDCELGDLDSDLDYLVEMRKRFGSKGKNLDLTNFKDLRASLDFPELSGVRSDLNGVHERLVSLDNLGSPLHGLIERISDIHNVMRPIEDHQHEEHKSSVAAKGIAWYQPAPGGVFREFSPFRDISTSFNSTVDSRTYDFDTKGTSRDINSKKVLELRSTLEGDMRNAKSAREDIEIHLANEKTYRDEKNSLYEARVDAEDLSYPGWRNQGGYYYIPDPKLASSFEEIEDVANIAISRFAALIAAYNHAILDLQLMSSRFNFNSLEPLDYLNNYPPDLSDFNANLASDFSEALELSKVSARFTNTGIMKQTNLSPQFLLDFGYFLKEINFVENHPDDQTSLRELRGLLDQISELKSSDLSNLDDSSIGELKALRNSLDELNLDNVFSYLFRYNTMKVRSWIGKNKCGSSAPQNREQKEAPVYDPYDASGKLKINERNCNKFIEIQKECIAALDSGKAIDSEWDSGTAIDDESDSGTAIDDDLLDIASLLPGDSDGPWIQVNPDGKGGIEDKNLLNAGFHLGVDTAGCSLRNANRGLRSEPPNPQVQVSPWLQTTICPDVMRRPLDGR